MPKEKLKDFRRYINDYYESLKLKDQEKYLQVKSDLRLTDLSGITEELFAEICLLEPFGDGNAEPVFEIDALVYGVRVLKEKHLALTIEDKNQHTMKMMAFYAPEEWKAVEAGDRVRVQFTLSKNEFGGKTAIEGEIISLEIKEKL